MAPGMGRLQNLDGQFGVMFEGLKVLVSQELLDVIEVGPAPDQLGGAAAPKGVGCHFDVKPGRLGIPLHHPPEGVVGHSLPGLVQKQGLFIRFLQEKWSYRLQIPRRPNLAQPESG